jgi:NAD+ synthase (glutamine-hydrolysing)
VNGLRVAGAQVDVIVGDVTGNTERARLAALWAEEQGADVLVLPELALPGYPPEDLLLDEGFVRAQASALDELARTTADLSVVILVGFAEPLGETSLPGLDSLARPLANSIAVLRAGVVHGVVRKTLLPTYGVFDEARYFMPSSRHDQVFTLGGKSFSIPVCEDLWRPGVADDQVAAGSNLLLVPNASPYHRGKAQTREELVTTTATRTGAPVVYVGSVGGQDEVVFDGGSMAVSGAGEMLARSPLFAEHLFVVDVEVADAAPGAVATDLGARRPERPEVGAPEVAAHAGELEEVYTALMTGLGAYTGKNGFSSVVLGLSGGIDSALVAALAADVLGPDKVHGIGMPGPYSSGGSVDDARELARRLGCRFDVLRITEVYEAELRALHGTDAAPGPLAGTTFDSTEENLQARLRMTYLMSVSNKFGNLLLTTGNKSETSVGYCTLYGDTAGGFAPIKDVFKTLVFDLCEWRNSLTVDEVARLGLRGGVDPIPEATITKPPSAELAPDQRDDQNLPPYPVLDGVLERYVERAMDVGSIVADGFDPALVARVVRLVDLNEYKRRQAAPGVKVTRRAFGRDRRLPLTNRWRPSVPDVSASTFPTKAEVELLLAPRMNALGISSWWSTPLAALDGSSPAEAFLLSPQAVVDVAKS